MKTENHEVLMALDRKIDTMYHHLSGQLDFLIQGDTECPWLFVLQTQEPSPWDSCNLLNNTLELRFLCAHSGQPVNPPMLIKQPKDWVKNAGPVVRFGLQAIKLGLLVGRITTGLTLPSLVSGGLEDLKDFKDHLDGMLHMIKDEEDDDPQASDVVAELETGIDNALAEDVDTVELQQAAKKAQAEKAKEKLQKLMLSGPVFRAVASLVKKENYMSKVKMKKVNAHGEVAWVHEDNEKAWLQARGRGLRHSSSWTSGSGPAEPQGSAARALGSPGTTSNRAALERAKNGNGLRGSRSSTDSTASADAEGGRRPLEMSSKAAGKCKAAPD